MENKQVINDFIYNKKIQYILKEMPMILDHSRQNEVLAFRRILEIANRQGLWNGDLAEA